MKKRDIIQLVKELVKEGAYPDATLTTQGMPNSSRAVAPKDEYPFTSKPKSRLPGVLDEEGASWGLEIRQLADSFTFEELEQLYNDNKITKEDLTGAKGYLQAWIDQHPTYLPQRDLNTSKRQAIRSYYLDPNRTTPKGGTQSSQFENKELSDNPNLQPGKTVVYGGTRYEVLENSGYILTLKSLESGKILKVNLNQFRSQGAIKEKNMKRKNIKQEEFTMFDPLTKTGDLSDFVKQTGGKMDTIKKAIDISKKSNSPVGLASKGISEEDEINQTPMNPMHFYKLQDVVGEYSLNKILDAISIIANRTGKHDEANMIKNLASKLEQSKNPKEMDINEMIKDYIKERGDDNLNEHVDKYHKRARLMEGATEKLFALFNQGKTDAEVRAHYLQMQIDMPDSFISKLRNNWESLRKTKLDLTLADKEAEGFQQIQQPKAIAGMEPGMEDGDVGMEEDKQLASGLFNETK